MIWTISLAVNGSPITLQKHKAKSVKCSFIRESKRLQNLTKAYRAYIPNRVKFMDETVFLNSEQDPNT